MKDTIENKIVDNYLEHKFHNSYDPQCSTCFNNVREFDGLEEDDINVCSSCSTPCANLYCDRCQVEIENGVDYFS